MNLTRYAFDCRIDMYHFYTDQLTSHPGPVPDISSFHVLRCRNHRILYQIHNFHTHKNILTHKHKHTCAHAHTCAQLLYVHIFIALTESHNSLLFSTSFTVIFMYLNSYNSMPCFFQGTSQQN